MWISTLIILLYVLTARSLQPYLPTRWLGGLIGDVSVKSLWWASRGLTFFLETGVFSAITLLIATLGDAAVAAHQIAINVWDVFYIPMVSIGSAITRMGHAWRAERAWRAHGASGRCRPLHADWPAGCHCCYCFGCHYRGVYPVEDIRDLALRLLRLAALFIMIDVVQIVGHLCWAL